MSKITLVGMYTYYNRVKESDFFSTITVPDGIDHDTLINNILLRGGEFETLYSDPIFMHESFTTWSTKWNRTFQKWIDALNIDYNPLENYDRQETWSDTGTMNGTLSGSETNSGTNATNKSAFDSTTLQPYDQNVINNSTNTGSTAEQTTSNTRTGRAHGNIGVTTSQQMLQSELDIDLWNIYEHITDVFIQEFLILIY